MMRVVQPQACTWQGRPGGAAAARESGKHNPIARHRINISPREAPTRVRAAQWQRGAHTARAQQASNARSLYRVAPAPPLR
jgi:hypothetical protein